MSDTPRSPSLRSPDRSPSLRQRLEERANRAIDWYEEWLDSPSESAARSCVGECADGIEELDCAGLAREKQAVEDAMEKAQVSEAMYSDQNGRGLPHVYEQVDNNELVGLGLLDPDTGESLLTMRSHPDFRADVFRHRDGGYLVAFRGTVEHYEHMYNAAQSFGLPTAYYSRANRIGRVIRSNYDGPIHFTGHSLAGGLANAGASAAKAPSTTFNAAGLHSSNMPNRLSTNDTRHWYVRGEILQGLQGALKPIIPDASGKPFILDPVRRNPEGTNLSSRLREVTIDRTLRLHGIDEVRASLEQQRDAIASLEDEKGCISP